MKLKCKYKFVMLNMVINILQNLSDKIWEKRANKVVDLINNLWFDNSVDLNILWLSEDWLKKFRTKLVKTNIIKKIKIKWNWKYYLNPYYANRGRIDEEIFNWFNK